MGNYFSWLCNQYTVPFFIYLPGSLCCWLCFYHTRSNYQYMGQQIILKQCSVFITHHGYSIYEHFLLINYTQHKILITPERIWYTPHHIDFYQCGKGPRTIHYLNGKAARYKNKILRQPDFSLLLGQLLGTPISHSFHKWREEARYARHRRNSKPCHYKLLDASFIRHFWIYFVPQFMIICNT